MKYAINSEQGSNNRFFSRFLFYAAQM